MEDVSAVAVGVGGVMVVFGVDLDVGDWEVSYTVGDSAGELPRWGRTMGAPIDEGRDKQEEKEKSRPEGCGEERALYRDGDEEGGGFCGIALEDALQLDHAGKWRGVEEPGENGTAQTFGAGVFEGDELGVSGVLRPAKMQTREERTARARRCFQGSPTTMDCVSKKTL